tara:strand:+ start:55870 stop:56595 length:726 start_codon:yes stop_codon:yes gene_type:complete
LLIFDYQSIQKVDYTNYIVISGDFIAYTSLSTDEKKTLEQQLLQLFQQLETKYNTFSRLIKGDYLECVVPDPENGLAVALAIKTFIKSLEIEEKVENNRTRVFQTYSIRLAMGLGRLDRFNREENIIDGDAIYRSGRAISSESTHNKERMVIKNTLFFSSINEELNLNIDAIISLLDHLLARATSRQSEVLFLKIMGNSEKVIAKKLGVSQSSINQHSTASGWNGMDKAIRYFNHTLSKIS